MRFEALLGMHGVTLRVDDLASAVRVIRRALGLEVLRRTRGEVVLGSGPECFVRLRRGDRPGVEEVHVAVRELESGVGKPDALGGRSVERRISGLSLIVRQFEAEPDPRWRRKPRRKRKPSGRPPRRSRSGGRAHRRASRTGST